ncbi:hypothetical protein [Pseudogulbenkiania sp. MAI-1]|uniref:hypothetical protein n=1 Tax=Pseudogulbenkiania sp. MAI-1 TaxID=990370 RepID=UPI00045E8B96|nr:hypothetical protein [Pseudogulbenkiania sp. MAI-1]
MQRIFENDTDLTVYISDPLTGEYLGTRQEFVPATTSLPPECHEDAPPEATSRHVAVWRDGTWMILPDWRGVLLWSTATGESLQIDTIGVTPADVGATDIERPNTTTVWDGQGWVVDAGLAAQQLLDLRARQLAAINTHATQLLAELSSSYPEGEVQSWAQQTREAEALAGDANAPTPLLTAIATARGLTVDELAGRVRAKVQAYAAASGAIIGQRQALEDMLMSVDLTAPDAATQLEAIQWPAVVVSS